MGRTISTRPRADRGCEFEPARRDTDCRSPMTRCGAIRRRRERGRCRTTRARPGIIWAISSRPGSGTGSVISGMIRRTGGCRVPTACSGSPISIGRRSSLNGVVNPVMPISSVVPSVFVSQEDVVWVESLATNAFSPVLPDLSLPSSPNAPALDWHYSWMFTGYQVSSSGGATFEGNIVVFENRPFGITAVNNPPSGQGLPQGGTRTRWRGRRWSRRSSATVRTCRADMARVRTGRCSCGGIRRSRTRR